MEDGETRRGRQLAVLATNAYLKGRCRSPMTEGICKDIGKWQRLMQIKSILLGFSYKTLHDWAPSCLLSHISSLCPLSGTLSSPRSTAGNSVPSLPPCLGSQLFHSPLPNPGIVFSWELPQSARAVLSVTLLCSHSAPWTFHPIILLITLKSPVCAFIFPCRPVPCYTIATSHTWQWSPRHVASPNADVSNT